MKIALVDDHLLLTEALRTLLLGMSEVDAVSIYNTTDMFVKSAPKNPPDMVIAEFMMSGISGLQLLDFCRGTLPAGMKIIVLSANADALTIRNAMKRGANGFLTKVTPVDELKDAIMQVKAGRQYIGKSIREGLLNSLFTEEQIVLHLSPREKEVLQKVCGGRTIKEIAYDLKLSAHTVQYYHRCVMEKLKVKRTIDLIVYAMRSGLYAPELHPN